MSWGPQAGVKRPRHGMGYTAVEDLGSSREAHLGWAHDFPERFAVLEKIGEGSFGTVWTGRERGKDKAEPLVALKRINPTCAPSRILNEFEQMRQLGGQNNVVEAKGILRTPGGSFALVMPFFQHDDFKDYIRTLTLSGIAAYMRSLLTALAHVHSEGVIHRDIKPRNFMYRVESMRGLLIDFGLAEPAQKWQERAEALAEHRGIRKNRGKKSRDTIDATLKSSSSDATNGVHGDNEGVGHKGKVFRETAGILRSGECGTIGAERSRNSGKKEDRSKLLRKVERAGTTGFRAPEILWHSRDQEPAVDVWSAGVVLLCLLSRRYPLFPSADNDEMALVQIAALCGVEKLQGAARESGRFHVSEFPNVKRGSIETLCAPLLGGVAHDKAEERMRFEALRLVKGMLRVDPRERVSATDALAYHFVAEA